MPSKEFAAAKLQVLAREAPVPIEVICRWLRKAADRASRTGRMVRMSPLTAQRIAAELEERR